MNIAVILAAGSSQRMGRQGKKELLLLDGRPVLSHSIEAFIQSGLFTKILVAYSKEDKNSIERLCKSYPSMVLVLGGSTRQKSVLNCLSHIQNLFPQCSSVLIHDGARPWVSNQIIQDVLEMTKQKGAAIPVEPSTSAMKKIDGEGKIVEHLKREETWAAQTPQGFQFPEILQAHLKAEKEDKIYIDDSEIWHQFSGMVWHVRGDSSNKKITYQGDI